jgi:hypothetical protein
MREANEIDKKHRENVAALAVLALACIQSQALEPDSETEEVQLQALNHVANAMKVTREESGALINNSIDEIEEESGG